MSNIPADLRYVASHEWIRLEADGSVTVGITDHAQEALGDVVYVELPEVGKQLASGQEAGVVESVKAASDIYAPISGEVLAVNEALADAPELAAALGGYPDIEFSALVASPNGARRAIAAGLR